MHFPSSGLALLVLPFPNPHLAIQVARPRSNGKGEKRKGK
jgi:hypothetical protein